MIIQILNLILNKIDKNSSFEGVFNVFFCEVHTKQLNRKVKSLDIELNIIVWYSTALMSALIRYAVSRKYLSCCHVWGASVYRASTAWALHMTVAALKLSPKSYYNVELGLIELIPTKDIFYMILIYLLTMYKHRLIDGIATWQVIQWREDIAIHGHPVDI